MKARTGIWLRFEAERLVRGESGRQIAQRLGVKQPYYSMIASGKRDPSLKFLNALITTFPEYRDVFLSRYIAQPLEKAAER